MRYHPAHVKHLKVLLKVDYKYLHINNLEYDTEKFRGLNLAQKMKDRLEDIGYNKRSIIQSYFLTYPSALALFCYFRSHWTFT